MKLADYLKENYSPTSVKGYENMIKRFKLTLGEKADKATYQEVLEYIGFLRDGKLHAKSLRKHLSALKIYFNYLVVIEKRADHPCKYLNLKDQINRQIRVESLYSKEILEELMCNYQAKNPENQRRDKIIISLLIYQALSVLEITQLKKGAIDLESGTINIKGNKKNKGRLLSLKPKQILLFHSYLQTDWKGYWRKQKTKYRTDYFLMNTSGLQLWKGSINRMINRDKARHERLLPIKIRQSVIANLVKENKDIRIVQEFAGHRRTASTEAYQQTGLEELKLAIEKLHPLQ